MSTQTINRRYRSVEGQQLIPPPKGQQLTPLTDEEKDISFLQQMPVVLSKMWDVEREDMKKFERAVAAETRGKRRTDYNVLRQRAYTHAAFYDSDLFRLICDTYDLPLQKIRQLFFDRWQHLLDVEVSE